jgi:hypothetical protein
MHRVLSDEAEEFRGYHCLGRSLQDSAHQLVQLLCHHALHRHLATEVHKTSRPWTTAGYNGGPENYPKTCVNILFDANSPCAGLVS